MSSSILVSTRKGLFTIERKTGGWEIAAADFLGDNVTLAIADTRDGTRYAALDHGHFGVKMHRSNGKGWHETPAPKYPEKPEGLDEKDMWGRPIPWSTVRVWALAAGGADEPGTLWCGTLPGGLFVSRDCGDSWQMCRSLWDHPKRLQWMGGGADHAGIHSICVDPRNSKHVCVGVSTGGLWFTDDGGTSWSQRGDGMRADHVPPELEHDPIAQDVHCLVQCQIDPERMWVQHHNGIFVSSDAGRNFRELMDVPPSSFGFPVAVHPREPDTAWFVPGIKDEKRIPPNGKLVVTRTHDGGKTFDVLTNGLPQVHAYDIIYRHGLDIDATGTMLAMGSTTGGLWVSENQGEHWQEISHSLPPVYAVRFV